jgi:hypothetical protein
VGLTPQQKKISLLRTVAKGLGLDRILWKNGLNYGKWMRFTIWNVRRLYRAGWLMTVEKIY